MKNKGRAGPFPTAIETVSYLCAVTSQQYTRTFTVNESSAVNSLSSVLFLLGIFCLVFSVGRICEMAAAFSKIIGVISTNQLRFYFFRNAIYPFTYLKV